ncbi:glycoside hydrolase family 97 N-terminal domain-containing protein, partial [Chryseobacterium sp.]|uniref:glycoside hydrolase family 97 N-terminal domain-containing protein n=1 Tax=Chryseobacterium sp. TaxID=1871047 RepID=UPI002898BB16
MKKITVGTLLFSTMFVGINAQSLQSPDGKFEMNFQLKQGIPYYNLKYNGSVVVEDSKLGLRLFKDTAIKF